MEKFNTIKNTTLVDRVKRAVDAFKGNPIGNLYFGEAYKQFRNYVLKTFNEII